MDTVRALNTQEELAALPEYLKVFISSEMASKSLAAERKVVADAIESSRADFYRAWYWERDAASGPYSSSSICIAQARTSDALILIIDENITKITKEEYFAAKSSGVPCFILLKDRSSRSFDAEEFIKKERQSHITTTFRNRSELGSAVVQSLETYTRRSHRLSNKLNRERLILQEAPFPISTIDARHLFSDGASAKSEASTQMIDGLLNAKTELSNEVLRLMELGHARGAAELIGEYIEFATSSGLPVFVLDVLEIAARVPKPAFTTSESAWMCHAAALANLSLGHIQQSLDLLEKMRTSGEILGDLELVSTSLQTLGAAQQRLGNLETARTSYLEARSIKRALGDLVGVTQLNINLSSVAQDLNEFQEAESILREIESQIDPRGDPHLRMTLHGNLGNLSAKRQDYKEAERHFKLSLKFARKCGDITGLVLSLRNLGAVNMDLGKYGNAVRWFRSAARKAELSGSIGQLGMTLNGLAAALHRSGRIPESIRVLQRIQELPCEPDNGIQRPVATANLGALLIENLEIESGILQLTNALESFTVLNHQEWRARVYDYMTGAYISTGSTEHALEHATFALKCYPKTMALERANVAKRIADYLVQIPTLTEKAATYYRIFVDESLRTLDKQELTDAYAFSAAALSSFGADELSMPFYESALQLAIGAGDLTQMFHIRNDRANALTRQGRFVEARTDHIICKDLANELNDRVMLHQTLMNAGEMERRAGNLDQSLLLLEESLELAREVGDLARESEALSNYGIALVGLERWHDASEAFSTALTIGEKFNLTHVQAMALGGLGSLEFAQGRLTSAIPFYEKAIVLEEVDQDRVHLVEDLAAIVELYAGIRDFKRLAVSSQQLVANAQQYALEELAWLGFSRAGKRCVATGDIDESIEMYATAVVLTFANGDPENAANSLSRLSYIAVAQLDQILPPNEQEIIISKIQDRVFEMTSEIGLDPREWTSQFFQAAREIADSTPDDEPQR